MKVSSWGGYVFLINLIPIHVFALMITGRFSHRVYVAYSIVYCLGTILSMQISFVGFQPIQSSEHMAAFGVFGLCQLMAFYEYAKSKLSADQFYVLFKAACTLLGLALAAVTIILTITGSKFFVVVVVVVVNEQRRPEINGISYDCRGVAVDWSLLLASRSIVCQEQHSDHRVRE